MVRSLYSGVAGMTSHQTRMDVIGNNIANVNTYGFKSSRATFSDTYYQTTAAATAATGNSGGTNPTQVGYGASVSGTDVNHNTSTIATTGYSLDVAVAGEGYLQVMDADGNTYYTKAGMLDIDAAGNVVDNNGYFVLGTVGSVVGQEAGSNKIKVNLPYESSSNSSAEFTINNKNFTLVSSENNDDGNVSFSFASTELPIGLKARATITDTSILITFNSEETFANMDEVNAAINLALTTANNGVTHPAGQFTLSSLATIDWPLTGRDLVDSNYGVDSGVISLPVAYSNYFSVTEVGDGFSGDGQGYPLATSVNNIAGTRTFTFGAYSGTVTIDQANAGGEVVMRRAGANSTTDDYFVLKYPAFSSFDQTVLGGTGADAMGSYTPSTPSPDLGLGVITANLTGGTAGGNQDVSDLTSISINEKGVITGIHATLGEVEIGRVDLATFANPEGLIQVGNTYFMQSVNSGEAQVVSPGENGTGTLTVGALELSNVDLSNEMSDMITTQRGFQANSRIITVSDSMLEELINLKR